MTSVLDDLASVLLPAAGLGLTFGTNLFAGLLPNVPDNAVALFKYPGPSPQYLMGPATLPAWEMPRIQVIVRNTSYVTGDALIESIVRKLEAVTNQTVNTTYFQRIERLSDPALLHRDDQRRAYFVANLQCHRTPS